MKTINQYFKRKYYLKITVFVSLTMIFIITIFLGTTYFENRDLLLENNQKYSKEVYGQIQYNIEFMHENIKNISLNLFLNKDVQYVMHQGEDINMFETMLIMEDVGKSVVAVNPFLHSVYIYNPDAKQYFSTYYAMFFEDQVLLHKIEKEQLLLREHPTLRWLENPSNGSKVLVFSYFAFEQLDEGGNMDGGIVVNVKAAWILERIKEINTENRKNIAVIVDANGEYMDSVSLNSKKQSVVDRYLKAKNIESMDTADLASLAEGHIYQDNDECYYVTVNQIQETGLLLIDLQIYDEAFAYMSQMKKTLIFFLTTAVGITLVLALGLSKRIYKPIDLLVRSIRNNENNTLGLEDSDEFEYIKEVFEAYYEKVYIMEKEHYSYHKLLKKGLVRHMLLNNRQTSAQDLEVLNEENHFYDEESYYMIGVYSGGNLEQMGSSTLIEKINDAYKQLIEIESIEFHDESIASIFRFSSNKAIEDMNKITEGLDNLESKEGISVKLALSKLFKGYSNIAFGYSQAIDYALYSFVYSDQRIITHVLVESNLSNERMTFNQAYEKQLLAEIRMGNLGDAESIIKGLIGEIQAMNYSNIIMSIIKTIEVFKRIVSELKIEESSTINLELKKMSQKVLKFSSLQEFEEALKSFIFMVVGRTKVDSVDNRNETMIEVVEKIIQEDFYDCRLNTALVAEKVKLSPKYLNSLYKKARGLSISDYINLIRLEKAAELLENTNNSVGSIANSVGIENRTYFYAKFKKKYGVTPKEYSIISALKKI